MATKRMEAAEAADDDDYMESDHLTPSQLYRLTREINASLRESQVEEMWQQIDAKFQFGAVASGTQDVATALQSHQYQVDTATNPVATGRKLFRELERITYRRIWEIKRDYITIPVYELITGASTDRLLQCAIVAPVCGHQRCRFNETCHKTNCFNPGNCFTVQGFWPGATQTHPCVPQAPPTPKS